MKFPYEKYIGVLLIEGKNNLAINRDLAALGFVELEDGELDTRSGGLQNLLTSLENEPEESKLIAGKKLFYVDDGIIGSNALRIAVRTGEVRDFRLIIQRLLQEGASSETIVQILADHGSDATPNSIRVYQKVLWDIKSMTPAEFATYIARAKDVGCEIAASSGTNLTSFPKRHLDIKHRWDHGKDITDLSLEDVSNHLGRDAYLRYLKAANEEDPYSQRMAIEWAKVVVAVRKTEALVARKVAEEQETHGERYIESCIIVPGEDDAPALEDLPLLVKGKPAGHA